MENNKINVSILVFYIGAAIVFAVSAILLIGGKESTFYVAYIATILVLLSQIILWPVIKGESDEILFKYPVVTAGFVFSIIQVIWAFVSFNKFTHDDISTVIVIQLVIIAVYATVEFFASRGMSLAKKIEDDAKDNKQLLARWSATSEMIYDILKTTDVANKAKEMHEATLYSNPKSNPACLDLEEKIVSKLDELYALASKNKNSVTADMLDDYIRVVKQRDTICKKSK